MIAYHGQTEIKEFYLARVAAHRAADEIIHGTYWEDGRGCAVGCCVHTGDHSAYERELGIPRAIARLEDSLFERLTNRAALDFPGRFLAAIPVGADLSLVVTRFLHWLLVDPEEGVIRFAEGSGRNAVQDVAALLARKIAGEIVRADEWHGARSAASVADAAAVYAASVYAASVAVADAAYASVADAAACAASVYAEAAAYAASVYAARKNATERQAEKFLELLAGAPVPRQEVTT
ncbi:MAG TPA: hypothetical protein VN837_05410 [Chloroflexota bacterium]|nr:hypothetical protein [Chloroflexota bacterium]